MTTLLHASEFLLLKLRLTNITPNMYFLRLVIHTGEELYTKSVQTGEEPHTHWIHDFPNYGMNQRKQLRL